MAWPADAVVTGDPVTSSQLNGLPVRIANATLISAAASYDFSNIPQHFAHLLLIAYVRSAAAATNDSVVIRFNNDSGANYDRQGVLGGGATVFATESFAQTSGLAGTVPAASGGANLFGALTVVVPHYANATGEKTFSSRASQKYGTTTNDLSVERNAGFWRSANAVTRMDLLLSSGSSLAAGTRMTLYGLP